MTARVIASFSSVLRITKQHLLIGAHSVDHFGLIVMALGDFGTLMTKHGNSQSHMGSVMDCGTGYEASTKKMRIDSLSEGLNCAFAGKMIEPILAKRPTAVSEPEPAGRLSTPEE